MATEKALAKEHKKVLGRAHSTDAEKVLGKEVKRVPTWVRLTVVKRVN